MPRKYYVRKVKPVDTGKVIVTGAEIKEKWQEHIGGKFPLLREVRYPTFTADMVLLHPDKARLIGYECKGSTDSLIRLKSQLLKYIKYFSHVVVITTKSHLNGCADIILNDKRLKDKVYLKCYEQNENGDFGGFYNYLEGEELTEFINSDYSFISRRHQLKQYDYIIEMIQNKARKSKK